MQGERRLVGIIEVEGRRQVRLDARLGDAVNPQDVGAEIAEQRSSEWRRPDPAHLDDSKTVQRSRHDGISPVPGNNQFQRWNRTASSSGARPTRAALALTLRSS